MMKGSGDEGKWRGREVVEKESGDEEYNTNINNNLVGGLNPSEKYESQLG